MGMWYTDGAGSRVSSTGIICAESGGGVYNQAKTAFTYQKKDEWILGKKKNNRELCTFYGYTSILPHHWQIVGNICISVLPSFTQSQQWKLVIALLSNELSIYQYFRILLNTVFLESDINWKKFSWKMKLFSPSRSFASELLNPIIPSSCILVDFLKIL